MFQSGFLIFIIRKSSLVTDYPSRRPQTIQQQYKQLIINNKITLLSSTAFNLNSLKYIMIKLGILFKEVDLLHRGLDGIQFFDLKTAHLLVEYILRSSSLPYIVNNLNDNFFIYSIKTAIGFILSQFSKRIATLQQSLNGVQVQTTSFINLYTEHSAFRELIILSKYLDILRQLDNDIHFNRKLCTQSLSFLINSLSSTVTTVDFQGENINYLTNQLNRGKIANAENYIKHKISSPSVTNLHLLKKMIVELYCYRILHEDEQMYSFVCINILRNVCVNPNVFFRNIAMKTRIKALRHFLIDHLKHSRFISSKEEEQLSFMAYIERNYSNPSFEVEYRIKATNTLLFKEYKATSNEDDNKAMITLMSVLKDDYQPFTSRKDLKLRSKKLDFTLFNTGIHSRKRTLLKEGPLLTYENVAILKAMIKDSGFSSWIDYSEIYDMMFLNSDVNDFGLSKDSEQKSLLFVQNESFYILQELLHRYFIEQDEKIYLLSNSINKVECVHCKKGSMRKEELIKDTRHFGYSNISMEDIKAFTEENINRIEVDDYLKANHSYEEITSFVRLYCNDNRRICALFNYIKGHYMNELLALFIEALSRSSHFYKKFIDEERGSTSRYFLSNSSFDYIDENYLSIFGLHNGQGSQSQFNRELLSLFLSKGILINDKNGIEAHLIRELIKNRLFNVNEPSMEEYALIREDQSKAEAFIAKHSLLSSNGDASKSAIDKCMDQYILFHENNYYLLQAFFDINLFNPKIIFSELYFKLDSWQRAIILSKFPNEEDDFIFNIAIENLNSVVFPNDNQHIILSACLIYLKRSSIKGEMTLNRLTNSSIDLAGLITEFTSLTTSILPKSNVDKITEPIDLLNTIKTHNEDISIRAMVNHFYPYLRSDNYVKWRQRGLNANMHIDDFDILIENGRIIDAYYYYINYLKQTTSKNDLANWLYAICFNNLLNYNVFATSVALLQLLNENKTESKDDDDTKEIIVQVEAANRILAYELNLLAKSNEELREALFAFIKRKNYTKDEEAIENNSEIWFYSLESPFKNAIGKYNGLVKQFQELKTSLKENNQKHATLIFDVLKRLEDSTWADKQNSFDQAKVDTSWHLVSLFCKINNYEMSLTNLHDFGRHNNWISFLHKAQEQDCSPMTIFTILNSYVTDEQLKKHLLIAIEPLINQADSNEDALSTKDKEKALQTKKISTDLMPQVKSLNDYLLFTIKADITKSAQSCDPLHYLTRSEIEFDLKGKAFRVSNILNEALQINWKEMLLVSLTHSTETENDIEGVFPLFGLWLYMSLKEVFISNFPFEKYINDTRALKQLIDLFDSKRKLFRLKELKAIIQFLLLNNYQHVISEAYELFALPFSFDEFILFTQSINNNDYENAFVHLYIFKETAVESFKSFSIDQAQLSHVDQVDFKGKPIECIVLLFFYSLADSIISSLLVLVETEEHKLFKLLEVLYLSDWTEVTVNYFKNLNVLNSLRDKKGLTYHSAYEDIVGCLVDQNEYDLLVEYMRSYKEESTDDVMLHKVFHSIKVFDKHYLLLSFEERNHFWDFIEKLLVSSELSSVKTAYLFLMIINDRERLLYLKEQLYVINKAYCYFKKSSSLSEALIEQDIKEMRAFFNSKGLESEQFTSCEEVLPHLECIGYVIIFSSLSIDQLLSVFTNSLSFNADKLLSNCLLLMPSLRKDAKRILFNQPDVKEKLYAACINLINLHQLKLCLSLCDYFNGQFDDVKQFESLLKFFEDNYFSLMELDALVSYQLYLKAFDERLSIQEQVLFNAIDLEEQLIMNVAWCLGLNLLKNQVLYELLKLTVSNVLELSFDAYNNFNENIEGILFHLMQKEGIGKELISHLNGFLNNGDSLLAKAIIEIFKDRQEDDKVLSLFQYVDFLEAPMVLGIKVTRLIGQSKEPERLLTREQCELSLLAYYCFLADTRHTEANSLNEAIALAVKANQLFYKHLFKMLNQCSDESKAKELLFCLSEYLFIEKGLGDKEWLTWFKSKIELYDKVKFYNKTGKIYMELAEEYQAISKEKKEIFSASNSKTEQEKSSQFQKEDALNILNYYIRAAENFIKDNCIISHSHAIDNISALLKNSFKEDIPL